MRALLDVAVLCPECEAVLGRTGRQLACVTKTCGLRGKAFGLPAVKLQPITSGVAGVPPRLIRLVRCLAQGPATVTELEVALPNSKAGVYLLCSEMKKVTGFHPVRERERVLAVARKQQWLTDAEWEALARQAVKPIEVPRTLQPKRAAAPPSPYGPPPREPVTTGPKENSNAALTPVSPGAITLGRSLREPFSPTDVGARLDRGANGMPAESRAGLWIAEWNRRRWIENAGFCLYRRTEKFGRM